MLELIEANPLPAVCQKCVDEGHEDCDECDHMGERWPLSPEDERRLARIAKEKAIARRQRELERLKNENGPAQSQ